MAKEKTVFCVCAPCARRKIHAEVMCPECGEKLCKPCYTAHQHVPYCPAAADQKTGRGKAHGMIRKAHR